MKSVLLLTYFMQSVDNLDELGLLISSSLQLLITSDNKSVPIIASKNISYFIK